MKWNFGKRWKCWYWKLSTLSRFIRKNYGKRNEKRSAGGFANFIKCLCNLGFYLDCRWTRVCLILLFLCWAETFFFWTIVFLGDVFMWMLDLVSGCLALKNILTPAPCPRGFLGFVKAWGCAEVYYVTLLNDFISSLFTSQLFMAMCLFWRFLLLHCFTFQMLVAVLLVMPPRMFFHSCVQVLNVCFVLC